jgi:hypothetical protein
MKKAILIYLFLSSFSGFSQNVVDFRGNPLILIKHEKWLLAKTCFDSLFISNDKYLSDPKALFEYGFVCYKLYKDNSTDSSGICDSVLFIESLCFINKALYIETKQFLCDSIFADFTKDTTYFNLLQIHKEYIRNKTYSYLKIKELKSDLLISIVNCRCIDEKKREYYYTLLNIID